MKLHVAADGGKIKAHALVQPPLVLRYHVVKRKKMPHKV